MLSPQRTAAVASRGAGEASNFPRTRSVVTHAAFQCFDPEVTSRSCRRFFWCGDGSPHHRVPRLRIQGRGSWSRKVLGLSPEPAASCGLVVWPVELRPVLGRACRAAARSGSGSQTGCLNGTGSAERLFC